MVWIIFAVTIIFSESKFLYLIWLNYSINSLSSFSCTSPKSLLNSLSETYKYFYRYITFATQTDKYCHKGRILWFYSDTNPAIFSFSSYKMPCPRILLINLWVSNMDRLIWMLIPNLLYITSFNFLADLKYLPVFSCQFSSNAKICWLKIVLLLS